MLITGTNRMQNDPVVSRASEIMRLGLMPSPRQLRDGLVRRLLLQVIPFARDSHTRSGTGSVRDRHFVVEVRG